MYATDGENVIANKDDQDFSALMPCSHEEADTRICVHVNDIANKGSSKVMIFTVDTDVVVLAVSLYNEIDLQELWVAFGKNNSRKFIPAHTVAASLGPFKSHVLPCNDD